MKSPFAKEAIRTNARVLYRLSIRLALGALVSAWAVGASQTPKPGHAVSYVHQDLPEGPWSVHIVKIDRTNPEIELQSSLARGGGFGLATLSEQIKALPSELGRPLAGLNGDFFRRQEPYLGDPQGLQIVRGELVSGPTDWPCFWVDPQGNPHITNVLSRFHVTWPTGQKTDFGLNEERSREGAVLYSAVVGSTTQTSGGRELILERNGTNSWLPLQVGLSYSAKVREVREVGNTIIPKDALVLSIGPKLAESLPAVAPGTILEFSTATWPDLKGVMAAVGGGPTLVRDGKAVEGSFTRVRHPRSAVGWNKDYLFFVEVDGRQRGLSVGMTIKEFARYLAKLGCTDAMNLDGGGSATCWVYGQVMNNPSEGEERGMGNALVVLQKEKK